MKRRYNLIHRTMSPDDIKLRMEIYGDMRDDWGELLFDPNNPSHLELPDMILMKCVHCGYEEEAEAEIMEEIMDMEGDEYPQVMCPECSSKKKTRDLGVMVPYDIFISDFQK